MFNFENTTRWKLKTKKWVKGLSNKSQKPEKKVKEDNKVKFSPNQAKAALSKVQGQGHQERSDKEGEKEEKEESREKSREKGWKEKGQKDKER